ncbi:MAG: CocE/NonD family hydrolase [Armatimonadetes bacterium]|nr:CocE/NonD family hydrolase [Armatimonadota bacterium]
MIRKTTFTLALFIAVLSTSPAQSSYVREHFNKMEVQIPMRDGVKLWTTIYAPSDAGAATPFLMMRTPYSCAPYGANNYRDSLGPEFTFTQERMIFVYQDVRGRYMSEGGFQWMTPYIPNKKPGQVDEATDTWDTIDWLLKNVANNNGRVGVYGTSFPGHYAAQCLIEPHPALKAVSPQAPMADNWLGDDMHHNGAFWLPHAMGFLSGFGVKRDGPTQRYGPRAYSMDTQDGYDFYLRMGPIANALTKYNMNRIELWKKWVEHPDYDAYWAPQNVPQHLKKAGNVAVLIVGGWWDAEDLQGPLKIHEAIEKFSPQNNTKIVMGPWYHGSWNGGPGTSLHDIQWTTKTGEDFRANLQKPFFRHYLLDADAPNIAEATLFDVGADKWREFRQWPTKDARATSFYLGQGGKLGFTASTAKGLFEEYLSDPAKPVPSSGSISPGMPRQYMIEDQRFAWTRPDVLTFSTGDLAKDTTLAGPVKVSLFVSTTGTDADFVVKLIDVFPNNSGAKSPREANYPMGGYQMLIRGEPMRARYRQSWSKPIAMKPGKVEKVEFTMPDVVHTFGKGHRIMVQVQSSWFPVMDRNPQTFVNIMTAKASDFKKATHRVYVSGKTPSRLIVGVL